MKNLFLTTAICLVGATAIAQKERETITVTTKDGDTGTFEVLVNDPDEAPNLHIGPMGFANGSFGQARPQYGLGADLQYTFNHVLGVNFTYSRGLISNTSEYPAEIPPVNFTAMDGTVTYYFSSELRDFEATIKVKSETQGNTTTNHIFKMPAKVQKMMGAKIGFSTYDLPVNQYISDGTSTNDYFDLTMVSNSAVMISAGIKKTQVNMLELDSKEFGKREISGRMSWYGDILFAPKVDATFFHRPLENGYPSGTMAELVGYEHPYKVIKAGLRLGYEKTAVFWKDAGIGTMYRIELGYRPGIKAYGGGIFFKVDYSINFGVREG